MAVTRAFVSALAPPLCASCGRPCKPQDTACARCTGRLASFRPLWGGSPAGLDDVWSSALYQGVARELVTALKFRRLFPVADLMAARVAGLAPATVLAGALVAVPGAPWRWLARGFDPTALLAAALAERTGLPLSDCLTRRGASRQVGRRRAERVADPPRVHACAQAPASVVLVDDVLTTGATLSACARALRGAGATRVAAVTFARRI